MEAWLLEFHGEDRPFGWHFELRFVASGQLGLNNQLWLTTDQHHWSDCWDNGFWLAGAEKSAMINQRPTSPRDLLGSISWGPAHRSCDPEGAKAVSQAGSQTWCVRVSHEVLILAAWKQARKQHSSMATASDPALRFLPWVPPLTSLSVRLQPGKLLRWNKPCPGPKVDLVRVYHSNREAITRTEVTCRWRTGVHLTGMLWQPQNFTHTVGQSSLINIYQI